MNRDFQLNELLHFLNLAPRTEHLLLKGFSSIYETKPETLSWMQNQSLDWDDVKASVVICSEDFQPPSGTCIVFIPVPNPRKAFALSLRHFCFLKKIVGISPSAMIGENCDIAEDVYIGHNVIIGDHVKIGSGSQILHQAVIGDNTIIGSACVIHSGAIIGADGFGYESDENGVPFKIPHLGHVILENNVEIGSHTCVARGVLSSTMLREGAKIGNLVHISHNVKVGRYAMITSHVHVSGSVSIGDYSWIAPGSTFKQGISVGEHSVIGLGAAVIHDVEANDTVGGVPAKSLKNK
ncbi:LpxD N-terminal domain-containing protein [Fictibacillus iocasae]|uniref:LpxD N-terminal domain-containing protein n=1 Tax=Fictibacillus iocasae TaxID=2715437 RepID=A0ABW2NP99_9BACL